MKRFVVIIDCEETIKNRGDAMNVLYGIDDGQIAGDVHIREVVAFTPLWAAMKEVTK